MGALHVILQMLGSITKKVQTAGSAHAHSIEVLRKHFSPAAMTDIMDALLVPARMRVAQHRRDSLGGSGIGGQVQGQGQGRAQRRRSKVEAMMEESSLEGLAILFRVAASIWTICSTSKRLPAPTPIIDAHQMLACLCTCLGGPIAMCGSSAPSTPSEEGDEGDEVDGDESALDKENVAAVAKSSDGAAPSRAANVLVLSTVEAIFTLGEQVCVGRGGDGNFPRRRMVSLFTNSSSLCVHVVGCVDVRAA